MTQTGNKYPVRQKRRTRLTDSVADQILFEADRTCCVCQRPGKSLQIHHIDGNPSNHNHDNLAALCLDHHAEASSKSSMSRGISSGLLKKYRDQWYAIVRRKRETALKTESKPKDPHDVHVEALACHEVRKLSFGIDWRNWNLVNRRLNEIYPYASSWHYGDRLRREVLDVAYDISNFTRQNMSAETAQLVESITRVALPIASLVLKSRRKPTKSQHDLLRSAIGVGRNLTYDGIKRLKNLGVIAAGSQVLWTVLRYAHLNGLRKLKMESLQEFAELLELANEKENQDAKLWLKFQRDDALALDNDPLPDLPKEVADRVYRVHPD